MKNRTILSIFAFILGTALTAGTVFADAGAAGKQNPMSQFIILGVFMVALYFIMIRPQTKRAKEHRALIESIAKDDEVVTSGGLVGKVTKVSDNFLTLMVAQGVEVMVQKGMISLSLPKGTMKTA